jgi:enoyl-CoA hydratase/carnithine racemase
VRIDRPKVNALSRLLLDDLAATFDAFGEELPGAVVVWGGERVFAAGADINELAEPSQAVELLASFRRAFDTIAAFPRATIAAISGYALGGGMELALACDLRVASVAARLGQPEILLGLIPGAGGTQRLARLVGPARAKDLVLTGRQVGADEALRIGLVDRVVAADDALTDALALASELAAGAVAAHGLAKRAVDVGVELSLADGLTLERELFEKVLATTDARVGMASFLRDGPGRARFVGE